MRTSAALVFRLALLVALGSLPAPAVRAASIDELQPVVLDRSSAHALGPEAAGTRIPEPRPAILLLAGLAALAAHQRGASRTDSSEDSSCAADGSPGAVAARRCA